MCVKERKDMARKNNNTQVADVSTTVEAVETVNMNMNMTVDEVALSLVQMFEEENAKAHEKQRGQSLPMRDIVEGVDVLLNAAGVDRASIRVLADKVPKLLAVKYAQMGNGTNMVAVKVGHVIKEVPNDELRAMRETQLNHMLDPKTKDNFYRRIYNIGFRGEGKRFETENGDLVRKRTPQ